MTDTRYVLTALPHSADASSPFHVSVVVSPRLSPDGALADFPVFESWTTELAAGNLTVADHTGVPFRITVLPVDDPANWKVVFPPTTPVLGFEPQSFAGKEWHSYAAGRMDQLAKIVHLVSLASDPIDPPLPSASPLGPTIGRLAEQLWRDRERPRTDRLFWLDETRLTRFLDDIREDSSSVEPILGMLIDLHEVRRFYERPESAAPEYLTKPVPGAVNVRPKPMEPDFHQRVALLGDQPNVQRQLGLVIDVSVTELDRLAAARWLTARLVLADGTDPTIATRVSCQVDEGIFTTVPRSGDWNGGRLRLGDSGRFSVLDLDPDASGLKLERFVVSVPRLSDIEENHDPVSAAPPTLQAQGFMVARNDRLDQLRTHLAEHQARASALGSAATPLLNTEDVNRGTRVEVWDHKAKGWFSLHLRSNQYTLGGEVTVDVAREEGFLQGAAAQKTPADKVRAGTTPKTYLGEALFGWSGWSLSAPHPALRPEFRYDGPQGDGVERTEKVGEASEAPAANSTNVVSRPKVLGGSLPRLRYGRSYAFRAWGVDLAGNSPPRPEVPPSLDVAVTMAEAALARSDGVGVATEAAQGELVTRRAPPDPYRALARLWRAEARRLQSLASAVTDDVDPAVVVPPLVRGLASVVRLASDDETDDVVGDVTTQHEELLAGLLGERRRRAQVRFVSSARAERVRRAVRAIIDSDEPMVSVTTWTPAALAVLAEVAGGLALAADTVTPLRRLLRWHPIDPPAVVPRWAYGEGESVRHLVVRSGVEVVNDPDAGDTITVVDPATYAAQVAAANPEIVYHDTCERHLAPPKASLPDAELHGRVDEAIGSKDPVDHQTALLVAQREAGTFFDQSIPSLTDPGTPIDIAYLRLEAAADADPTKLVDLETLEPGEPLGPGQYLVADTEQLELPYLPDSLATGVSLRFQDAGLDRPDLRFASGIEGMVADLHGAWPALEPYRLVLRGGAARGGVVDNVIDVALPAGDTLRTRLASAMAPSSLTLFGVWNLLPATVRADPEVERAAADGWLWALSPSQEVRFVHAVPRPLEAPRPIRVVVLRVKDSTGVFLIGGVDLHGPSTSRLDADATWTETVDDLINDGPEQRSFTASAFSTEVGASEDLLILGGIDQDVPIPSEGVVRFHASRHELGDTKHRLVDYRLRATSRFTEYFHPSLVATPGDRSVVGRKLRLSLPNAARPPKPVVREMVPLFRWEQASEPEQPFALRRTRRAGVRIYLDRPWFVTGDGELLAVVCAPTADDVALNQKVSQWGRDPVWERQKGPEQRRMLLEFDHLFHQVGLDDRDLAAYPVGPAQTLPLVDLAGVAAPPKVTVLGYEPQYDGVRRLWYVDVAIDPGSAFWPFVRLVVARYQPESLTGLHLSPTVRLDYAQVVPTRTATLSRVALDRAQVVVTGHVGHRGQPDTPGFEEIRVAITGSRRLLARLEERDPTIDTDLGWTTRATTELELQGFDAATWVAGWEGDLVLPAGPAFQQPGQSSDWRVTVEEFELYDPDTAGNEFRIYEPRVIYADHLPL